MQKRARSKRAVIYN